MQPALHCDVETRSTVDLKKVSVHRYFEEPNTDVWCMAWAIGDGPVNLWKMGEPPPPELVEHINAGLPVFAHNAGFERTCFRLVLGPRYGFPVPKLEQFFCTAAMAAAMALPRDLASAAAALGLPQQKDMRGRQVMLQMARPRRREDCKLEWWDSDPEKLETLYAYCKQDVVVERELEKRLRPLSDRERRVWLLDQQINERGVPVDVQSVQHATWILHYDYIAACDRLRELTGGVVSTPGQRDRLIDWLATRGIEVGKLDKKVVADALEELGDGEATFAEKESEEAIQGVNDPVARQVLQIRQEQSKSSTKKLNAFVERASADRRARDNLMYAAASTLRWGGRGIQLQNLPRRSLKKVKTADGKIITQKAFSSSDLEFAFDALAHRDPNVFKGTVGPPGLILSDMLRGMIKAEPGKKLIKGDYSNIEGRVLAWLAEEQWKLDAFAAADRKEGPDIYLLTAAKIFGVPASSLNGESPERQVGKVAELACGYGGGVGAFQTMAALYDVTIPDSEAHAIVQEWRTAHSATVRYWERMERAVAHVLRNGGVARVGKIAFAFKQDFMWAQKPNGEYLCYPDPRVRLVRRIRTIDGKSFSQVASRAGEFVTPSDKKTGAAIPFETVIPPHDAVTVMSVNSQTRKWERVGLYGGLLAENLTQAVSRDVMVEGMFAAEAAGYPVILTVHDELITEVEDDERYSARILERLMVEGAAWTAALPLRAEAAEGYRYSK